MKLTARGERVVAWAATVALFAAMGIAGWIEGM